MDPLLYLAGVLILPMIPAFLMFKYLPSTVAAAGPFGGLKLNLTGGFGGYFILLILAVGILPTNSENLYTFEAYFALEADTTLDPRLWYERIQTSLIPPVATPHPDGRIQVRFAYDPAKPKAEQPSLHINVPECGGETIRLVEEDDGPGQRNYDLEINTRRRTIARQRLILLSNADPDPSQRDSVRIHCGRQP